MLTTTACLSCAVPLAIPSHAKGKMISCINCGHEFKVDSAAEIARLVPRIGGSSQGDRQDQPSRNRQAVMPLDEEYRKRPNFAVLGVLFGLVSLACLWAWFLTHLLPWIYCSGVSWYAGAHLSLFGKGPIKIVGLVLNMAVMASCIVAAVLFKGLIRIELGW
jgi:hypothetical protein